MDGIKEKPINILSVLPIAPKTNYGDLKTAWKRYKPMLLTESTQYTQYKF